MNNKTKYIISAFLVVIIIFSLFGCSNSNQNAESPTDISEITTTSIEQEKSSTTINDDTSESATKSNSTTNKETTSKKSENSTKATEKDKSTTKKGETTTSKVTTTAKATTTKAQAYCNITIECTSILSNMSDLKSGHSPFVPSDGYILKNYKYVLTNDSITVYDVLKSACNANSIKLTVTTSIYGIYVSGINNIDEKDCGKYSGWLYKVNSVSPSYSCDKYTVSNGDNIIFTYTCTGE